MKTNSLCLAILMAAAGLWVPWPANAYATYSVQGGIRSTTDFYEPLAPYGYWVQTARYGWGWYPADVDRGWRPYAYGHWLWSDQGWYWESDEPWAWATYHYGRWTWDLYYGWVWIPDVEWAPSWVCWREGGGYVGWAPLPPPYDYAPASVVVVVQPQYFIFVEHRHFCQPIQPSILVVNQTVINQTVNITKFGKGSQVIVNPGPNLAVIERNNPGRVVKVKPEHRLPPNVQQSRQQARKLGAAQPIAPPVISGTRHSADASTVVRMPLQPNDSQRPAKIEKVSKGEHHLGKRLAPPPPAPVVAQPKPQALPPTAVSPEPAESNRGRKVGHHKQDAAAVMTNSQGR